MVGIIRCPRLVKGSQENRLLACAVLKLMARGPIRTRLPLLIALVTSLLVLGCSASLPTDIPSTSLKDLQDIDELRELFNQDDGAIRLVLLLSPT